MNPDILIIGVRKKREYSSYDNFVIEKNVPIPTKRMKEKRGSSLFSKMEVGDSFIVSKKEAFRVVNNGYKFAKMTGTKFSARYNQDGSARIWRIA